MLNDTAGTPAEMAEQSSWEANDPFGLRRYSLRRYSVRHMLMLLTLCMLLAVLTGYTGMMGLWLGLGLSAVAFFLVLTVFALMVRTTKRRVVVEQWIRRLGAGDFEHSVPARGNDELSKCCVALETLRLKAIEAMQLNRVRTLSEEIQAKNSELEAALATVDRTQDQIVARRKLAEMGELSAGVAHEMSNPISLAKNFAEASVELHRELDKGREAMEEWEILETLLDLAQNNERVLHHLARAASVVEGMLTLSGGGGDFEETDINHLAEYYGGVVYQSMVERDPAVLQVRVDYRLSPDSTAMVVPEDMARVIANLVRNAVEAVMRRSAADPDLDPAVFVGVAVCEETCAITVADNGVGISESIRGQIFNPFFTTKPPNEGTGLGLAVCNDIVREHGGELDVETEPGAGTTMTVRVPTRPGESSPALLPP